jgi:acetyl/propionyl-CoA carboxylase alpha subunit
MNTRLQVEHPITEETLNCDLVRAQLEVASGAGLPSSWTSGTLSPRGHAIELRLYAEDPMTFLPRSGRLLVYREPAGPGIRVDAGVAEGSVVGVEYDPLLAKLVVSAADRKAAIERARRAVEDWVVLGVETNLALLRAVLGSEGFLSGNYATDLVERIDRKAAAEPPDAAWIAAASALEPAGRSASGVAAVPDPWTALTSWRSGS